MQAVMGNKESTLSDLMEGSSVLTGFAVYLTNLVYLVGRSVTRPGPTRAWARVSADLLAVAVMDISDCHYVSDFARDEVVPDQTPVLVR